MSTLGDLRKRFVKLGEPGLAESLLAEVTKMRNMAVHRFFWDDRRSVLLNTPAGQATLMAELDALATEWSAVAGHIRAAMIRLGLDLTQGANPVIQRIRALQRGEVLSEGPFTDAATRLVQQSPASVERVVAQLMAASPEGLSP